MMEHFIELALTSIATEGKRILKLEVIQIWIDVIEGFRRVIIGVLAALFAVILLTTTAASLALHSLYQYQHFGFLFIDPANVTCLGLLLASLLTTYFFLRESQWFKYFNIGRQQIQAIQANKEPLKQAKAQREKEIQKDELRALINELLEQKLQSKKSSEADQSDNEASDNEADEQLFHNTN